MLLPKYKPKYIPGYEGLYGVTKNGKVYSFKRNKFLKPKIDKYGYSRVTLYKNSKGKYYLVHRLVALTYIPNPNKYPQINHINEIKIDNRIENLEWCSSRHNINYGTRNKRSVGTRKYETRKVKCIELNKIFNSIQDANEYLGKPIKNNPNISNCCKGKYETAYGYHWKYID